MGTEPPRGYQPGTFARRHGRAFTIAGTVLASCMCAVGIVIVLAIGLITGEPRVYLIIIPLLAVPLFWWGLTTVLLKALTNRLD